MKAKKLQDEIVIGVFSSSSPISATIPTRYDRGIAYLQTKGIKIIHGNLYRKKDYYRSGTIKQRADEFNQLLYNEDIHILMASIGGYNTNSILPYIDYEYLKKHPKIIIGYSDVTALLLAIYAKTGLVTFYGPSVASSFGEFPPLVDLTYDYFERFIKGRILIPYQYDKPDFWTDEFINWVEQKTAKKVYPNEWICVNKGMCQGKLIGGNLNTMEGIFQTEYMPIIKKGDILFIEDSFKDASIIERSFSLLKLSGILDRVGGIILGKHEKFNDNKTNRKPYEILLEVMGKPQIPILADFDCCHTHPMLTIPIGCEIILDATNKTVTLLEDPLE